MKNRIVEICGIPGSGKTTVLGMLRKKYHKAIKNGDVQIICDPSEKNPIKNKNGIEFDIWNLNCVINELIISDSELIIIEKGLIDIKAWFNWHVEKKNITSCELEVFNQYSAFHLWYSKVVSVVFLNASEEEIYIRKGSDGNIVNRINIPILNEKYQQLLSEIHQSTNIALKYIDTTPIQMEDLDLLLKQIDDFIKNQV